MIKKSMQKQLLLVVILMAAAVNTIAQEFGEYYIRFKVENRDELMKVTKLVSIDNYRNDTVYAYVNGEQLKNFKQKTGYSFEFYQPYDAKSKVINMADQPSEMANWDRYPTYELYVDMMNQFATDYPGICKVESIGTSVDGRKLLVAKISDNVDTEEDEPEFFYTSTMHGDETTGYVLMLRLIDSLLSNYNTNSGIKNLVDNIEIYINPNANPDGTYAGGNSTISGATRGNANGVDLNRDFPDPISGPNKPWQAETQVMMDFAANHNIVLSANFHGGTEVVNYPWDGTDRAHVDESWFKQISLLYANSAMENSPSDYFKSITSNGIINGYDWYPIEGGRQDFMTSFYNGREVTLEISDSKLLSSDLLPDYWDYNKEALFLYMKECLYGIRGIVTDTLDNPLQARVKMLNHDLARDSSFVFSDPAVGNYHRMIDSGTYDIEFYKEGYNRDTVYNVNVDDGESVRVDVKLEQRPVLSVEPGIVSDYIVKDSTKTKLLKLSNIGVKTLEYDVSVLDPQQNGWLSVDQSQGTIDSETDSLFLTMDATGMETGIYETRIKIHYNYDRTKTIPVEMIVNSSEVFSFSPDTFRFSLNRFEDTAGVLELSNKIAQDAEFYLSLKDSTYKDNLIIDIPTDTIEAFSKKNIEFNIIPSGLEPLKHQIDLVLTDHSDYLSKIPVILDVIYEPVLSIEPGAVSFTLMKGETDSVLLTLYNNSEKNVKYNISNDYNDYDWLEINQSEDSIQPRGKKEIQLKVLTSGVDTGEYSVNLGFSQSYDDTLTRLPVKLLVMADASTGIDLSENTGAVEVYPNPFDNRVMVDVNLVKPSQKIDIKAYNATGKLLKHFSFYQLQEGSNPLSLYFDPGILKGNRLIYLEIETGNDRYVKKLIHLE